MKQKCSHEFLWVYEFVLVEGSGGADVGVFNQKDEKKYSFFFLMTLGRETSV